MPILEMRKLQSSYRERNRQLFEKYQINDTSKRRIFNVGEVVDGNSLSDETVFFVNKGHCVRYTIGTQGEKHILALVGPSDILGLGTRLNYLRINGGMRIIETMVGTEIPLNQLIEWNTIEPMFLYENMQHDLMSANNALRMNGMKKKKKIYYAIIELLRDNHVTIGHSLRLNPYISQAILAEFTGSSKGYVSTVLTELKRLGILNPYSSNIICDNPQELVALSEYHQDFYWEDILL